MWLSIAVLFASHLYQWYRTHNVITDLTNRLALTRGSLAAAWDKLLSHTDLSERIRSLEEYVTGDKEANRITELKDTK